MCTPDMVEKELPFSTRQDSRSLVIWSKSSIMLVNMRLSGRAGALTCLCTCSPTENPFDKRASFLRASTIPPSLPAEETVTDSKLHNMNNNFKKVELLAAHHPQWYMYI